MLGSNLRDGNYKIFANFGKQQFDNYRQSLLYGKGQRAKMADGSGTTRWSYDRSGQVIAKRVQIDTSVFYTRWGYNAAGLQSWMRYPGGNLGESGELITMTYLPQRLLNSLVGTSTYVQSTTYDAAGRADVRTLMSSLQTDYNYNSWAYRGGRLTSLMSGLVNNPASLQQLSYSYDLAGNILNIYDYKAGNPQTQTFGYDSLNCLTGASASGGTSGNGNYNSESYTYNDNTGNLQVKAGAYVYLHLRHLDELRGRQPHAGARRLGCLRREGVFL